MKSRWQSWFWCWTALAAFVSAMSSFADDDQGRALLNTPPPEWQVQDWINSPPLKLAELKGKVVLVRWWTSPGCPYCAATAPALNDFHASHQKRGLVVIGFYHHKSPVPMKPDHVVQQAAKFGFKFPVATDPDWQTLNQWWLKTGDRDFTSVTFLLDQAGRIQYIHPGGEYPQGSADWKMLKSKIESLLGKS
jgi:peroxiredoxin